MKVINTRFLVSFISILGIGATSVNSLAHDSFTSNGNDHIGDGKVTQTEITESKNLTHHEKEKENESSKNNQEKEHSIQRDSNK